MIHKLFTWPLTTVKTVGEKVKEEVDKELYDVDHIHKKLSQLQMQFEMGDMPEDEFEEREEELLKRYRIAKEMERGES